MTRRTLMVCLAMCWLTAAPGTLRRSQAAPGRGKPAVQDALPVLGEIPPFSYLDQEGRRIGNADLLGHVWVADFIFTQCTTACPILSARLVLLQRTIVDPSVRFVSFSVDPAHDTPAVLKTYAARWQKDTRWHLLATTMRTLPPLVARMGVVVEATGDPADPITHTDGYLLVDAVGLIRGIYRSDDAELLKRLAGDVSRLARSHASAPAPVTKNGEQLFNELGCAGCHADPHLASPLAGLFGRTIKLADNRALKVDEAYLRESITTPAAKLAAGYPASMPSYAGVLSPAQLDTLVEYLKALPAADAAGPARHVAVDPVCKMELSAGPDTRHVEHGGKTYYFCSDTCRDKFTGDPARYQAR